MISLTKQKTLKNQQSLIEHTL